MPAPILIGLISGAALLAALAAGLVARRAGHSHPRARIVSLASAWLLVVVALGGFVLAVTNALATHDAPLPASATIYYTRYDDLGHGGTIYAARAASGAILWQRTPGGGAIAPPALAEETLYFGAGADVYAVRASDGTPIRDAPLGAYTSAISPIVSGGVVYATTTTTAIDYSAANNLFALRAADGTQLWRFAAGSVALAQVADGVDYVTGCVKRPECGMYALRATDGTLLWRFAVEPASAPPSVPQVASGIVSIWKGCLKPLDCGLYALRAADGTLLWHLDRKNNEGGFALADRLVYRRGNGIFAVDAASGAPIWQYAPEGKDAIWPGGPFGVAAADGAVYVGASEEIVALDARTGSVLWRARPHIPSGAGFLANFTLTVNDGILYATGSTDVLALRAGDGHLLWGYAPGSGGIAFHPPVVVGDVAFMSAYQAAGFVLPWEKSSPGIYTFDTRTGQRYWHADGSVHGPIAISP